MAWWEIQELPENNDKAPENAIQSSLDNLEAKAEKWVAIWLIKALNNDIEWNNEIKLSIREDSWKPQYYIIWWKENTLLNIPLDIESLEEFCNQIETLMNFEWKIQLLWWKEWRAIADKQLLWWSTRANKLIYKWLETWSDISYYIAENNKTEELFAFVQRLKWIPEEDWIIDKSIKNSWPIWLPR